MSELYNFLQAEVMLRGNEMQADSASALATSYTSTTPGATELGDRGVEFPPTAINDCMLSAEDAMVRRIGANPKSPYRNFLTDVSASVASGALIPIISSGGKSRIGVIGDVRDAGDSTLLTFAPKQVVLGVKVLGTNILKKAQYLYYEDHTRIWHTRTNITTDMVIFDKSDERTLMTSSPRGTCKFPQDLHEMIVCGALSYMFRGDFNAGQVGIWRQYFNDGLAMLGPDDTMKVVSQSATD